MQFSALPLAAGSPQLVILHQNVIRQPLPYQFAQFLYPVHTGSFNALGYNLDLTRRTVLFFLVRSRTQFTRFIFPLGAILVCPGGNGGRCRDVVLAVKRIRGKCTEPSAMEAHRKFHVQCVNSTNLAPSRVIALCEIPRVCSGGSPSKWPRRGVGKATKCVCSFVSFVK
jgi:hypothetical protein